MGEAHFRIQGGEKPTSKSPGCAISGSMKHCTGVKTTPTVHNSLSSPCAVWASPTKKRRFEYYSKCFPRETRRASGLRLPPVCGPCLAIEVFEVEFPV